MDTNQRFEVWLDSGANIHSCYRVKTSLEELNLTAEEFEGMSDDEKEEMFKDIAFNRSDWGWREIE
jgi:hypothetical protein